MRTRSSTQNYISTAPQITFLKHKYGLKLRQGHYWGIMKNCNQTQLYKDLTKPLVGGDIRQKKHILPPCPVSLTCSKIFHLNQLTSNTDYCMHNQCFLVQFAGTQKHSLPNGSCYNLKWCLHHEKKKKILTRCPLVGTQHTYIHTRESFPRAPVAFQRQEINTHLVEMGLMVPLVFAQLIIQGKQGTLETMKCQHDTWYNY